MSWNRPFALVLFEHRSHLAPRSPREAGKRMDVRLNWKERPAMPTKRRYEVFTVPSLVFTDSAFADDPSPMVQTEERLKFDAGSKTGLQERVLPTVS